MNHFKAFHLTAVLIVLGVGVTAMAGWEDAQEKATTAETTAIAVPVIERWIKTSGGIGGITISPDGEKVYVAYWGNQKGSPIEEYSLKTGEALRRLSFDDKHCHGDVAISRSGRYLFTTHYYFTHMSRFDLNQNGNETTCELGGVRDAVWAGDLDASPDGRLLLVALGRDGRNYDMKNDQISIIDITGDNLELIAEVKLPDEPAGHKMGFSRDSRFAYIVTTARQSESARLYEISLERPFRITRSVAFADGRLEGVAVHDGLGKVFVSDSANKKIWVVGKEDFKVQGSISLEGCAPGTLLLPAQGDVLYALSPSTRSLWCVDARKDKALSQVKGLGRGSCDIEITPDGSRLLVSHNSEDGGLCVIKLPAVATGLRSATDGKIVFSSDREGNYQIYSMSADGKDMVRLTKSNATEKSPRWSPDGEQIAFISDRDGPARIYVMRKDGTQIRALENADPGFGDANAGVPLDWSPDGSMLVFVNSKHTAIRIVGADGNGLKTLIEGKIARGYGCYHGVCWRWEKDCILFNVQNPDWGYDQDIFSVNPETGKITQITDEWGEYAHCLAPTLSPDGRQIAVVRQPGRDPPPRSIFLMSRTGNNLLRLTKSENMDASPRWTVDGKKILFCSGTPGRKHIWAVNADGSDPIQLTSGDSDDCEPDSR